jgi:O-antigen/teichoic acid export membrane protein
VANEFIVARQASDVSHPNQLETPVLGASVARNGMLLSIGAGVVGVLSYAVTLVMANALKPADFSQFAAAQTMLSVVGIVTSALVPVPLSQAVTAHPQGSEQRRDAMAFAGMVSVIVGCAAALLAGGVTLGFGSASLAAVVALSAFVLFIGEAPSGWIQGELLFARYTVRSVGEIVIRLIFSLLVVMLAWGAPGAVLGFAMGGLALLITPRSFLRDLTWRPRVLREKWRWAETSDIALTLCVVSILVGIDVVLVAFLAGGSTGAAGFQALASIAKAPVYVAAGTVLVVFPLLRRPGVAANGVLTDALRFFGQLALVACAVIATAPHSLVALVMPERYHSSFALLPWLALSGLGYAALTVLATVLLALRAYRRCQFGLLTSSVLVLSGLFLGWNWGGVPGVAIGCAVSGVGAACVLIVMARPLLPPRSGITAAKGLAGAACLAILLKLAGHQAPLWLMAVLATGLIVLAQLYKRNSNDMSRGMRVWRRSRVPGRMSRFPGRRPAIEISDEMQIGGHADGKVLAGPKVAGALASFFICLAIALAVRAMVSRVARSTRSR